MVTTNDVPYFPDDQPWTELPRVIASAFQKAKEEEHIYEYGVLSAISTVDAGITYSLQTMDDLAKKPVMRPKTPDLENKPEFDPLAGPEFKEGELIAHTDSFVVMNNKFALAKEHIMLVAKKFQPQARDLNEKDLFAILKLLFSYRNDTLKALAFFNGGPLTGASQPHLHIQLIPFSRPVIGPEGLLESLDIPLDTPTLLDLPYVHYAVKFTAPVSVDKLHSLYSALLETVRTALKKVDPTYLPPPGARRNSYNLILTDESIHLIPRRRRSASLDKKDPHSMYAKTDWQFSINALPIAGIWHVPSEQQGSDLVHQGLISLLRQVAYPRELW